jgi:non-heme chloroperoxidase
VNGSVVASDGTRLGIRDSDGTGRPVVLLHAWGLNGHMWNAQLAAMHDAGLRTVTVDRRGHGVSDRPAHGYDLATLTADVTQVLSALDLHDVVLVGHSMGGLEAAATACSDRAGRVSALILSAPTTPCLLQRPDNPLGVPAELLDANREAMRRDIGAWITANTTGYWGAGDDSRPVDTTWTQQTIYRTPLNVLLATNQTMVEADLRADLASCTIPTLVIQGDQDLSAPFPITGQPTAELLPNAALSVVDSAGHGLYASHADTYNAQVLRFIDKR